MDTAGNYFVAIVDSRRLHREALVRSLTDAQSNMNFFGYASVADFLAELSENIGRKFDALLLNCSAPGVLDQASIKDMANIRKHPRACPVVILAPSEELDHILAAIDAGAAGYVPTSVGIDEIVEVTRLAATGGIFFKIENLSRIREVSFRSIPSLTKMQDLTSRQVSVADALRQGKANKLIAYELNMCESTVKVHVRSIMKKLEVRNRTEAAFKLNSMLRSAADL